MALILLGIAGVLFGGAVFTRSVSNARSNAWAGPRTKGQRGRTQRGLSDRGGRRPSLRADFRRITHEALTADWLDGRKHDRAMAAKNGGSYNPVTPDSPPAARRFSRPFRPAANGNGRVIPGFAQRAPAAATAGPNGHGTQTGGGSSPGAAAFQPRANGNGRGWRPGPVRQTPGKPAPPPPPPRQASQPPQTSTSSGGNGTVASGNGGVEQLVQGYNTIYTEAMAGNIHAKHAAIKALTEGFVRGSQMLAMLARELSEPGHNFGPEVTEPLAKAAQHSQASSMATSESDAALASLLQMSVGELATSSRQAPHHSELSENGSR